MKTTNTLTRESFLNGTMFIYVGHAERPIADTYKFIPNEPVENGELGRIDKFVAGNTTNPMYYHLEGHAQDITEDGCTVWSEVMAQFPEIKIEFKNFLTIE